MIKVLGQEKSVNNKSDACYWCGAWRGGLSH